MSPFKEKIIAAVKMVPHGQVASYGQIALMVGLPRAGRFVGQVLKSLEEDIKTSQHDIPWWRIVNNAGRVSIKGTRYHTALMQKMLLEEEGVRFGKKFDFEIEKYRFRPEPHELKNLQLEDRYIQKLIDEYLI